MTVQTGPGTGPGNTNHHGKTGSPGTLARADVVIVGGGPAGIAAAVAAARNGASTLLLEQYGCLGGMMTVGLVMPFSAYSSRSGKSFGGIMEEMRRQTLRLTREYAAGEGDDEQVCSSPHVLKYVALDLVIKSGAKVLFHAMLADVVRNGDRIESLVVCTKSGLCAIEGDFFIDATGDGDLLARAGEEFVLGSEPGVLASLTETGLNQIHETGGHYGEYETSGQLQPASLMFTMGNVNEERAGVFINKRLRFSDLGLAREAFLRLPYANTPGFVIKDGSDDIPLPQKRVLFFKTRHPGEVVVNMTRVTGIDGTDALQLSNGEVIAQQQTLHLVDFLKRFVPGFENAFLRETGSVLGVRETRRLIGRHVLTGREAVMCVPFEDVIAHGSYIIDIHDPRGQRGAIGGAIKGDFYDIPWRSLLPKTINNLLVAGRCISADHVAHSSTRIQGTCMLTGQAAGTAAAIATRESRTVFSDVDAFSIQSRLLADGVRLQIPRLARPFTVHQPSV
ncbi:MAG: FAD-dependent oxidoreductase [Opitutaceae bacterium]|jgi:hypothetical protein|nr:FAD-dependent oxidoreductase [Opitutaceae bacterium]